MILVTREWNDLLNCQLKFGNYSDTPFLVVTAALLQLIMPIAIPPGNGLGLIGLNLLPRATMLIIQ